MALSTGTRLGPYEVISAIGAGGMGEVYKARDTRLERTVAIKILPEFAAADPEFRARFEREAKTISQLNHPNICVLFDVGESTVGAISVSYLVMEHLEGETLAERLKKGPLPPDQVLPIAVEMAEALDTAHRKGIIHRDLKPGNIMLTASGSKLLDFGLAKPGVVSTNSANSIETRLLTTPPPSATVPLTSRGSLLGTFQYMSPEQIEGGEADARSDIWAFGCVIYEMVTARHAFDGKSQASLIASILERQPPPMAELQPMTPPALGRVVRTCLAKSPDDRFQTAHDLALQLKWIEEAGSAAGVPAPVIARRKRRDRLGYAAGALVVGALGAGVAWIAKTAPAPPSVVTRFTDVLPEDLRFTRGGRRVLALSRDGSKLVYVANNQLYVRNMEELTAQPIPGTATNPAEPVFSPDGEWVAYWSGGLTGTTDTAGHMWRIPITGGTPTRLCEAGNPLGMSWDAGKIVWGTRAEIRAVVDTGGTAETLVTADASKGEIVAQPQLIDNGRLLLFTLAVRTWDAGQVVVQRLGTTDRKVLAPGTSGRLLAGGRLVFYQGSTIFGIAFDAGTLTVRGTPVPLVQSVRTAPPSAGAQYSVSESGTLAYLEGASENKLELVWVDRTGKAEKIAAPQRGYYSPRLSPDDTRVATEMRGETGEDIYIWDLHRSTETRVTVAEVRDIAPVWVPPLGDELLFSSELDGVLNIMRRRADLTRDAEPVTKGSTGLMPMAVSPNGESLLLLNFRSQFYLSLLPLSPAAPPPAPKDALPPLISANYANTSGVLSPDGKWIAYEANESGEWEVFVRPFPNVGDSRSQISQGGAMWPAWSRNGKELFYVRGRLGRSLDLMSVAVKPSPRPATFDWNPGTPLFPMAPFTRSTSRGYDVAKDGRFVMVARPGAAGADERAIIHVVSHWMNEVVARVK